MDHPVQNFEPISREKVRLIRSLARRRERHRRGLYLLEGKRLVGEGVSIPERIEFVYGVPEQLARLDPPFNSERIVAVEEGSDLFLTESSQQIGAVCRIDQASVPSLLHAPGPLLLLDHLSDPGNVGTIIRSADWFGFRNILATSGTVDPWNPKSVRSTMGGILRCNIAIEVTISTLAESGRPIVGLQGGGERQLGAVDLPVDGIYAVGSEATGLSPEIAAACSTFVAIPGGGGESLNAAMASTLLLWELFGLHKESFPIDVEQ